MGQCDRSPRSNKVLSRTNRVPRVSLEAEDLGIEVTPEMGAVRAILPPP